MHKKNYIQTCLQMNRTQQASYVKLLKQKKRLLNFKKQ